MSQILDTLHVIQDKEELRQGLRDCNGDKGYYFADTRERGRIMFTHSGEEGDFRMSTQTVLHVFKDNDCDCLVCCHPGKQYKQHPELSRILNILYPDVDIEIFSDTHTPHIMLIGSCEGYWDVDDYNVYNERRPIMSTNIANWELQKVKKMAWTQDKSGLYTLIHRATVDKEDTDRGVYVVVRLDIMREEDDYPLQSFKGLGNDVRMHCIKWINDNGYVISPEHASYIGYELCRAMKDEHYIQD